MNSCEEESPIVLFRPLPVLPINFHAIRSTINGKPMTYIARVWTREGAENCTLCETCTATIGREGKTAMCSHRVAGFVPDSQIEGYRFGPGSAARLPRDPRAGTGA